MSRKYVLSFYTFARIMVGGGTDMVAQFVLANKTGAAIGIKVYRDGTTNKTINGWITKNHKGRAGARILEDYVSKYKDDTVKMLGMEDGTEAYNAAWWALNDSVKRENNS